MKVLEAVEALNQGHCIVATPSDFPVNECDSAQLGKTHLRLYNHTKLVKLKQVTACVAEVQRITTLEEFAALHVHSYLNFSIKP